MKCTEQLRWSQQPLAAAVSFRLQSSYGSRLEICHRYRAWQQLQDLPSTVPGMSHAWPLPRCAEPLHGGFVREQSWEREGRRLLSCRQRRGCLSADPLEHLLPSPESENWLLALWTDFLGPQNASGLSAYLMGEVTCIFHQNAVWQLREVISLEGQLEKKKTEVQRLQTSKPAIHLLDWRHRKELETICWNLKTQRILLNTTMWVCHKSSSKHMPFCS